MDDLRHNPNGNPKMHRITITSTPRYPPHTTPRTPHKPKGPGGTALKAAEYPTTPLLQQEPVHQELQHSLRHREEHKAEAPDPQRAADFLAEHTARDLQDRLEHLANHLNQHTSPRPDLDLGHLPMMQQQLENARTWLATSLREENDADITGALTEMEDLHHDTEHAATHPFSHLTMLDHLRANWPATHEALQPCLEPRTNGTHTPECLDPNLEPQPHHRDMLIQIGHAHQLSANGWSPSHTAVQAERLVRNLTQGTSENFPALAETHNDPENLREMASHVTDYVHQVTMATRYLADNRVDDFAEALTRATGHTRSALRLTQSAR